MIKLPETKYSKTFAIISKLWIVVPDIIKLSINAPNPGFLKIGKNNLQKKNLLISIFSSIILIFGFCFLIKDNMILQMHLTEYGIKYILFIKLLNNSSIILITLKKSIWYNARTSLESFKFKTLDKNFSFEKLSEYFICKLQYSFIPLFPSFSLIFFCNSSLVTSGIYFELNNSCCLLSFIFSFK